MNSYDLIESMKYHPYDEISGDGIIEITLRDLFKPYLLHTEYCDKIVIWWDCQSNEHSESMKVYAVDGDFQSRVKAWYDVDITKALKYISDNLV